uniref:Uncharacterized protein n=1 Tax=Oncorhynchus tshawytscha TaxID=74940 RepID=A0A8C8IRC8_ONCTS
MTILKLHNSTNANQLFLIYSTVQYTIVTKLKLCSLNCVVQDKWLLHSVLMLVQSWSEPSVYLQTTLDNYDDVPDTTQQDQIVMLDEGMLATSYYEQDVTPYNLQPEVLESVLRDYTLLSCFKKDPHKMETFLKLLNFISYVPLYIFNMAKCCRVKSQRGIASCSFKKRRKICIFYD